MTTLLTDVSSALASQGSMVAAITATFPEAFAVYAFGSHVHGTAGPQSDLDLAVLLPGYSDPLLLWELAGKLADIRKDGHIYAR